MVGFNDDLSLTPRPEWTDAQDTQARELAKEGKSRRQIAITMGMTRSAVAGYLWRNKDKASKVFNSSLSTVRRLRTWDAPVEKFVIPEETKKKLSAVVKEQPPVSKMFKPPQMPASKPLPFRPTVASRFITLAELETGECKFPVGGGACCEERHLFCGAEAYKLSPYCFVHHHMCYNRRY